jgi:hypothetical protein
MILDLIVHVVIAIVAFCAGYFLLQNRLETCRRANKALSQTLRKTCEVCVRYEVNYNELLYSVETKYDGESRHETARRYIQEREYMTDLDAKMK